MLIQKKRIAVTREEARKIRAEPGLDLPKKSLKKIE